MSTYGVTLYQPLADYLTAQPPAVTTVTLTPAEIEAIIGRSLSPTARRAEFWTTSGNQPHTRTLRQAGWRITWRYGSRYVGALTFERIPTPRRAETAATAPVPRHGMTRYQPVSDYLAAQPPAATRVRLTFSEIEALVGRPLPATAYSSRWWSNSEREPRSRIWRAVGWRVSTATLWVPHPAVTFERVSPGDITSQVSA